MRLAYVAQPNLGPYHLARFRALVRRNIDVVVLRVACKEVYRPWKVPDKEGLPRIIPGLETNQSVAGLTSADVLQILDREKADAILVLSCGVGVQSTATMIDIRCVPGLNTISLGGTQGIWPSNERCGLCGDCLLALTGGICPITMCSKSLVNGTCGGTNDGKCEVSSKKDCGWYLIYKRLEELGRTEDLLKLARPRDHALQLFPDKLKNSIRWALEVDNAEPAKESSGGKK